MNTIDRSCARTAATNYAFSAPAEDVPVEGHGEHYETVVVAPRTTGGESAFAVVGEWGEGAHRAPSHAPTPGATSIVDRAAMLRAGHHEVMPVVIRG